MIQRLSDLLWGALALLGTLAAVLVYGRRQGQKKAAQEAQETHNDTLERMRDADTGNSADDATWLEKRGRR